jgi:hypothetical protein
MLEKESKIMTNTITCAIQDIPVVEGSQVEKSPNVTEWDVPEGVFMHTVDPSTGEKVYAPITKISQHRNLKMYDVKLINGTGYPHVITVSEDHSLIAYSAKGTLEKFKPTEVKGNPVPKLVKMDGGNSPDVCVRTINLGAALPLSYDLGLFLGMMIGDGWVSDNWQTYIAAENVDIQNKMLELINDKQIAPKATSATVNKLGNHDAVLSEYDTERFGSDKAHRINLHISNKCAKALKDKIGAGALNKKIPWECLNASKAHLTGLLCGLLATDGCIRYCEKPSKGKKTSTKEVIYHTISPLLRDGMQDLCRRLGIRTSVTPYMGVNSKETCYAISLSLIDCARLYNETSLFRMIAGCDEEAMCKIAKDITESTALNTMDIVPFPRHLSRELRTAGCGCFGKTQMSEWRTRGSVTRSKARDIGKVLKDYDWNRFDDPSVKINTMKTDIIRTAEEAVKAIDEWLVIVEDEGLTWENVQEVTEASCTEAWDMTVPGPYTFTLSNGTVVQDTMNYHVPVSQQAVKEAYEKMLPSRNLLSPSNMRVHYKPVGEFAQGLFLGSRINNNKKKPIRFNSLADAQQALKEGLIKWDDPIDIPDAEADKLLNKSKD